MKHAHVIGMVLLVLPAVHAAPVAGTATGLVTVDWGHESRRGWCAEQVVVSWERVNSRLLVEIQSSTQGLGASTTATSNTDCALPLSVAGGVYHNPCLLLRDGVAIPAVNVADPYFYPHQGSWRKYVSSPGGEWADFYVNEPSATWLSMFGYCAAGSSWGYWRASFPGIAIG